MADEASKITLRIPADLHAQLSEKAWRERKSLNQCMVEGLWTWAGDHGQAAEVARTGRRFGAPQK